ncbi:hypothetical protein GX51_00704 [Blastomyces parvus]|uniref:Uncharacterized protein n=1 Tax=Blastomyces parvus TaxID=2060905 RepID=A0A2B7XKT1_9EURO|nr:hypothetical protein GX51_00704 [Blastomyces parvus]
MTQLRLWSICPLTGGIVNVTVRALRSPLIRPRETTQRGDCEEKSRISSPKEIFWVREFDNEVCSAICCAQAPFDRARQVYFYGANLEHLVTIVQAVEANALALFAFDGPLSGLPSDVLVPQFIHHDKDSHLLIIEKLRNLAPLSDYLCPGRGINGDVGQLLAHLHLYLLASKLQQSRSAIYSAVLALIQGINDLCHARSLTNGGSLWTLAPSAPSNSPPPTSPVARTFRSVITIHGREIINNAI